MSKNSRPAPPDPVMVLCGQSPVCSVVFGPGETYTEQPVLVSGHENGHITFWSVVTQRIKTSWQGHEQSVIWLAWTLPDKFLSQGRDGVIKIWSSHDATSWISIGNISCAEFVFCGSSLIRHNYQFKLAVPSGDTSCVNVHVIEESVLASWLPTQTTSLSAFLLSVRPSSVKNYVAYENGNLVLFDVMSGNLLNEVTAHDDSVMAMDCWVSWETDEVKCVTGSASEVIKSWQIEGDNIIKSSSVSVTNPGVGALAIRVDGRLFVSGGWDNRGRIFSLQKLKPLAVLTYHTASIQCVAFAPNNTFATGSKDGYIALWDVYKAK